MRARFMTVFPKSRLFPQPVRVLVGCLGRELYIVGVPSGRMKHGGGDPALAHLLQTVLRSIARDLPVLPGRRTLRPDVDLSIDDQHGGPPRRFRAAPAMLRDVPGLPIVSLEATPPPRRPHPRRPVRIAETGGNRVDPHQWHLIASSCIFRKMGSATSGVYSQAIPPECGGGDNPASCASTYAGNFSRIGCA